MRKWSLFFIFTIAAIFITMLSYYVAEGLFVRWPGFENLRFPTIEQNSSSQETSQKPSKQDRDPKTNKQDYIKTIFDELGAFKKIEGHWLVQGKRVSSQGYVVYRSDKHQMTLRLTGASFEWDTSQPNVMHNPIIENIEVTTAWPMADPYFAEEDNLWNITGTFDIKAGQLILLHALNENYEILRTSFTPIKLGVSGQKTGRILDNIFTALYNLCVTLMLEADINGTQKIAEILLSYMVGMPVKIGSLEGDLSEGKLIFENILLGEESNPLLQFSQGKITYTLDKSQPKLTRIHVTDLSLFDPITFVHFSPQEKQNILLSQSLIPVGDRLLNQGQDISAFVDRLYIPISYEQINIGEGFIELRQNEQSMRRQVSSIQMKQAELSRISQYTASQTYGLMAIYFARLSETAATIYADQAQQASQSQEDTMNNNTPQISGGTEDDLQGLMNDAFIPPQLGVQIEPSGDVSIGDNNMANNPNNNANNNSTREPLALDTDIPIDSDLVVPNLDLGLD